MNPHRSRDTAIIINSSIILKSRTETGRLHYTIILPDSNLQAAKQRHIITLPDGNL